VTQFARVPYEPSKRDAFLALMRDVYEGTAWSPEEFDWWFERNPTGRYIVTLAEENGTTIGAACQSFARLVVDGEPRLATFTVHVMTHPLGRGKGVFSGLQLHNDALAAEQGADYALGFTNPQAGPIFISRLGWDELCWLRLWARPKRPQRALRHLRSHDGRPRGGVRAGATVEPFGARHEEIYRRAAPGWAGHVVKDNAYLEWRYRETTRTYASFSTDRGFAVVGWGVYRGLSAGTICELVGGDGVRLLRRCVHAVDADVVIAMPNRGEERTYLAAGFAPTPAAIRLIGRSLKQGVEVPHGRDRWRFSLGDTDIF
jgi:Acetyltransferase (GNAT) domain